MPEESTDTFINSGLCQVDTPCPLGENLDRFLHLLGDIKNRKDDYAAQLSSLTVAAMSLPKSSGEESERSIIREVFTPGTKANEKQQSHDAKLWQARLVLAIGEHLDRQEEEIAANLSAVDEETSGLFHALHGDTDELDQDSPFAELSQLTGNFSGVGGNMSKRLGSWTHLFAESSLTDAELFVTTSADILSEITEQYENISGGSPSTCTGLELPGFIGRTEEQALAAVKSFRQKNSASVFELENILRAFINNEEHAEKAWDTFTGTWNSHLETMFPAAEWGRLTVSVNVFKACNLSVLIGMQNNSPQTTANTVVFVVL